MCLTSVIFRNFNPRSSCEERLLRDIILVFVEQFQSTLLMRGATTQSTSIDVNLMISIHAPHARSDSMTATLRQITIFQSTLLMRGATHAGCRNAHVQQISIHAPHARSDKAATGHPTRYFEFQSTLLMRGATTLATKLHRVYSHFNPRSSCEERHHNSRFVITVWRFQSTLLMRGATGTVCLYDKARDISIHAPHARSDPRCCR